MSCSSAQLAEVTAKVLEEAAFLSAEPDEGLEAGRGSEPELVAQLTFGPPLGGWMRLEASRALAMTLAANLLGCEPDDPEVQTCAPDALGELLNVAAGVLAGALLGPEKPCRLGIPLVGSPAPGAEPGEVRVVLRVEEEHVLVVAVGAAAGGGA